MLKEKMRIGDLYHKEHLEWLNQLDFYQEAIAIFQQELLLTLHRHPKYWSILEHANEYRHIFLQKLKRIDDLKMEIILLEKQLTDQINAEAPLTLDIDKTRRKMRKFALKFEELKGNFRKFVARNT